MADQQLGVSVLLRRDEHRRAELPSPALVGWRRTAVPESVVSALMRQTGRRLARVQLRVQDDALTMTVILTAAPVSERRPLDIDS